MSDKNRDSFSIRFGSIDPYSIVTDVLKSLWAIFLGAAAAAMIAAMVYGGSYDRTYTTSTTFAVSSRTGNSVYDNLSSAQTMASTFGNLLNSSILKKEVCKDLGLDSFTAQMKAEAVSETNLLVLSVTADSPRLAFDIIRSVMKNYPSITQYTISNVVLNVLVEPVVPYGPDQYIDLTGKVKKAFVYSAVLLALMFALISYFSDTLRNESDMEDKLDAKVLGVLYHEKKYKSVISAIRHKKTGILITNPTVSFGYVEDIKKIAARLAEQAQEVNDSENGFGKVILISSVRENEGKSTIAANVALALSRRAKRVLLIDGDLRKPSQALIFGMQKDVDYGFRELLLDEAAAQDAVIMDGRSGLYVLPGIRGSKDSTELVSSDIMKKWVGYFRKKFDYIIIDTPPMSLMADAEALADQADVSALVVRYHFTYSKDVNDAIDVLDDCNCRFGGCILNQARILPGFSKLTSGYGGYGRYGRYGRYGYGRHDDNDFDD